MALLPDTQSDLAEVVSTSAVEPNLTYRMNIEDESVSGNIKKDLEAVQQAIYKILNTERYKHVIYSWDYGAELSELIGKPVPYCLSEIPRRIRDALIMDDRIDDVVDFDVNYQGSGKVLASFTVQTIYGDLAMKKEVAI